MDYKLFANCIKSKLWQNSYNFPFHRNGLPQGFLRVKILAMDQGKIVVFSKICHKNWITTFKNHEICSKFQRVGSWVRQVLTPLRGLSPRHRFKSWWVLPNNTFVVEKLFKFIIQLVFLVLSPRSHP